MKPTVPTKMCEDETTGQMFGLKLALCFSTSNSDVTLGAFSKWFKFLHPLSAVEGMLNQRERRPERIAKDSSESGSIALDNQSSHLKQHYSFFLCVCVTFSYN